MTTTIRIPAPLRAHAGGAKTVEIEPCTVGDALEKLVERHVALRPHLFNDDGKPRAFVNLYLGDEDVRYLQGLDTPIPDGGTLSIIPSVAGGANDETLTNDEVKRYSRHLVLPEIGMQGQRKLKAARVLVVGTGGLGSPVALYLAAAGVGTLGLVDFDVVDESNLQRQIAHGTSTIGKLKVESAKSRILDINPHIDVITYNEPLTSENALQLIARYDMVVDGTDNFQTRYLVNDACVLTGKPNVYGSIFRFDGQASVFAAKDGPCYRCLYAEPPPPGLVPSCAEGGVLGVLPGVIGTIQATEAIKLITGAGDPLIGRMLIYDALEMSFRTLKLRKDPNCAACGEHRTITQLIDYDEFCGVLPKAATPTIGVPEITVQELKHRLDDGLGNAVLIDVREPYEWDIVRIPNAKLIPKATVPDHFAELGQASEVFVHCRSGARSADVVQLMLESGFTNVRNVKGGVLAWAREIDPSLPTY
jgi:adenylyltransferase/sulfurtransferase